MNVAQHEIEQSWMILFQATCLASIKAVVIVDIWIIVLELEERC